MKTILLSRNLRNASELLRAEVAKQYLHGEVRPIYLCSEMNSIYRDKVSNHYNAAEDINDFSNFMAEAVIALSIKAKMPKSKHVCTFAGLADYLVDTNKPGSIRSFVLMAEMQLFVLDFMAERQYERIYVSRVVAATADRFQDNFRL